MVFSLFVSTARVHALVETVKCPESVSKNKITIETNKTTNHVRTNKTAKRLGELSTTISDVDARTKTTIEDVFIP